MIPIRRITCSSGSPGSTTTFGSSASDTLNDVFSVFPSAEVAMTETGFREMGWELAVLEQQYREHVTGWDFYLPRLASYAATLWVRP